MLRGVTNDAVDPSVDAWRTVTLPLLHKVGVEGGLELKVYPQSSSAPSASRSLFQRHENPRILFAVHGHTHPPHPLVLYCGFCG